VRHWSDASRPHTSRLSADAALCTDTVFSALTDDIANVVLYVGWPFNWFDPNNPTHQRAVTTRPTGQGSSGDAAGARDALATSLPAYEENEARCSIRCPLHLAALYDHGSPTHRVLMHFYYRGLREASSGSRVMLECLDVHNPQWKEFFK
jgi:hypothetical protein